MLIVKSQQSAEDGATLEELYSAFEQISSSREGGFMSDDKIAEKLNLITETVIRLEERTRVCFQTLSQPDHSRSQL
ncbi:hypothetical protein TRIPP_22 [Paenibacillus phage Tripp]|uniref:Uncharacterized protein n=1 Tax=Paenibacillus phage Tripp TaxID=1718161 RepID=A0A0N9RTJ2_9CAUD|nr:hypothetical protein TRIPP_22 [Paenibacillus phage Tripp]ALH46395.1 hypothetical protein TRIPP_22 [Paenibacillus phage Tripp]